MNNGSLLSDYLARFEDDPAIVYVLDQGLNIAWCNAAWDGFALSNGGEPLLRNSQVGRNVVEVTPAVLRPFYAKMYAAVMQRGQEMNCEYECSSDRTLRRFHMHLAKLETRNRGSLLVIVNSLILEAEIPDPGMHYGFRELRDENGLITMCSHCRRTRKPGSGDRWMWVPELVREMPPDVSHGLCSICFHIHYGA